LLHRQRRAGRKALDLGFFISLSGIVTFKNARDLQATAKTIPADRCWSRPIRRSSPRCRTAARPASRRSSPTPPPSSPSCAASRSRAGRSDHRQLLQAVRESRRVKVRILGCGTSTGVPRIGNDWGQCDPAEPRNRRLRSSILVESGGERCWSIAAPTCASSCSRPGRRVDRVIVTHDHADHCHGIDDLRPGRAGARRAGAAPRPRRRSTALARFAYAFDGNPIYPPCSKPVRIGRNALGERALRFVDQPHGGITSLGMRFDEGSIARLCD
jgi:hypothetical protein